MTTSQTEQFLTFGSNADMVAMDKYIATTTIKTTQGQVLKDEWRRWYDGLSWYTQNVYTDRDTLDAARNRITAFNKANALSEEEKQAASDVSHTGVTLEESEGGVRRTQGTGLYAVPKKPLIPTWVWWAGGAAVVGVVVIGTYGFAMALPSALLAAPGRLFQPKHREP